MIKLQCELSCKLSLSREQLREEGQEGKQELYQLNKSLSVSGVRAARGFGLLVGGIVFDSF